MQDDKGKCKHGEFNLLEGCYQCIEERRTWEAGEPGYIPMEPVAETALATSPKADVEVISHLYELADQFRFLGKLLDDAELPKEVADSALSELKGQLEEKVENIGKFYLSLQANIEVIKTEEQRLGSRRVALENKADWLKGYLLQEMTVAGVDKVKKDLVTVSVRSNPPSVNIVKEDDIPQEYRVVIPERWNPDKRLIIEHFKSTGEIVPGVEIITDKKSVQIR